MSVDFIVFIVAISPIIFALWVVLMCISFLAVKEAWNALQNKD